MNNLQNEQWRPVPGFEGLYSVSDHGRVRGEARIVRHFSGGPRRVTEKLMKPTRTTWGYLSIILSKEDKHTRFPMHRLVLLAFVGQPKGKMDACHKDGCKTNNRLENLRWDTRAGNMQDVIAAGKSNRGERCPTHKLQESEIAVIRFDPRTHSAIAAQYGVAQSTITRIKNGRRWAHV
jgi:hypothetical protein